MKKQSEFIYELGDRMRLVTEHLSSRDVRMIVEAALDLITETLSDGGEVSFRGFGAFKTHERPARVGVNPRNPAEHTEIPARRVVKFTPGTRLKESVQSGEAQSIKGPRAKPPELDARGDSEATPSASLPAFMDSAALMLELNVGPTTAEAIMRQLPTFKPPGDDQAYVSRDDVRAFVAENTRG